MTLTRNVILIAIFSLLLAAFFGLNVSTHPASDNDRSRLMGAISIVRFNKLEINDIDYMDSGDKVFYKGKYYSSKPPLLHVFAGLLTKYAFAIKPQLYANDVAIYRFATFVTTVVPLVFLFGIFALLISRLKRNPYIYVFSALFLVFGTLVFSYSRHLNNHIIVAIVQLFIFAMLFKKQLIAKHYLFLGVCMSLAFALDVTYGFVLIPVTVLYLFVKHRPSLRETLFLLLGLCIFSTIHFSLSYWQFGSIIPPQMRPEVYLAYPGSKWINPSSGIEALNHPLLVRIFNYSIGTHGLFLYQPLLILPLFVKRNWQSSQWVYVCVLFLGYLLFNSIMQPNYGGSAFGPRRYIPLIPMFYYFFVVNWVNLKPSLYHKVLISLLVLITLCISVIGYTNP